MRRCYCPDQARHHKIATPPHIVARNQALAASRRMVWQHYMFQAFVLFVLFILPWVQPISLAVTHVATSAPARNVGHTVGTAYTITSTTAGNGLIASTAYFNSEGATVTGITGAGTWTKDRDADLDANSHIELWSAPNISGGTTSLTVTTNDDGSPTVAMQIVVMEFSGLATSSMLDVAPTNTTGTGDGSPNAIAITSGTLAQADEVIVAVVSHTGADLTSIDHDAADGFTQAGENLDNDDGQTFHTQFLVVAATTSVTANWTFSADRTWTAILASYKGAGGAAPTWGPLLSLRNNRLVGV